MSFPYKLTPLGDSCVLVHLGEGMNEETHALVMAAVQLLEKSRFNGFIECVPAFTSIAVHYNPIAVWRSRTGEESTHLTLFETVHSRLTQQLKHLAEHRELQAENRRVTIPVCYGNEFGPDLELVAEHCGMSTEEVVNLHCSGSYKIYMIGFAPGFPYLGGMNPKLTTPRRQTPRTIIPAGSVGIAGGQTGVYPLATPGGWQLIGRTPLALFRPAEEKPSLLQMGDIIRFKPISAQQLKDWGQDEWSHQA